MGYSLRYKRLDNLDFILLIRPYPNSLNSVAQINGEVSVVRPREQNAVAFVVEREVTELDYLAYPRGNNNLRFYDLFEWLQVVVD